MDMKALPFFVGFSILGAILLVVPISVSAQSGPCGCKDRDDLVNQLNKTNAALDAAEFYMKSAKPTDMTDEIPDWPAGNKQTWKEIIDGAISQASYDVDNPSAQGMIIKVDGSTCEPSITAGTKCLKSIADKSAPLHKAVCLRISRSGGGLEVVNYLRSLSDALRAEVRDILSRLQALPKSCGLDDWVGSIRYSFVRTDYHKNEKPGVVETIEDTLIIKGVIRLNGKYPLDYWKYPSSWEATGEYGENKESKGTRACKGGLATAKQDGNYKRNHIFKWNKNGEASEDTDVSIGEVQDGNNVPIEFRIPKIVMKTSGFSKDSETSSCPKPNGDFDGPPTPWDAEIQLDSQKIFFIGSYFPGNPEKISGSSILESGKTGTAIVTFNLYKLKP